MAPIMEEVTRIENKIVESILRIFMNQL